jgi:hypothetical protein
MLYRSLAALVVVPLIATACGDKIEITGPGPANTTVRFINATNSNIDVSTGGTVGTGNSNIGFGGSSSCMTVNASQPALVFNQTGTSTAISGFTPNFTAGGNFSVIAFPSGTTTQFVTIDNAGFTPASGQAGLRIFNAASGSGNLVALAGGTALGTGTGVGFGTAGAFTNVAAGLQTITFNTGAGTATVANAGTLNFTAGQNYTLIVAPAAAGSTTLRTFLISGC